MQAVQVVTRSEEMFTQRCLSDQDLLLRGKLAPICGVWKDSFILHSPGAVCAKLFYCSLQFTFFNDKNKILLMNLHSVHTSSDTRGNNSR